MNPISYKRHRFPPDVIRLGIWLYYRFTLSLRDVEDLLAERGVTVSRETIPQSVNRFGGHFASCIRRDRPGAADKWHLDEVIVPINGRKCWLWRAVDRTVIRLISSSNHGGMLRPPGAF